MSIAPTAPTSGEGGSFAKKQSIYYSVYRIIVTMKRTTIQVTTKLRDFLRDQGHKGESYEDIIWRLINGK